MNEANNVEQPIDQGSASSRCSSRRPWQAVEIYVGRKFRGVDPKDHKRKTLKVIDVTFGGDVFIYRRSYGEETWQQSRFLGFVETAIEISV